MPAPVTASGSTPGCIPSGSTTLLPQGIEWIADFYDERYTHLDADVVICRHTLEHIPNVADFMTTIRRFDRRSTRHRGAVRTARRPTCARRGRVLGHVLRALLVLQPRIARPSLPSDRLRGASSSRSSTTTSTCSSQRGRRRFRRRCAACRRRTISTVCATASTRFRKRLRRTRRRLAASASTELADRGGRAVIWGSGSKGVSFISNLALGRPSSRRRSTSIRTSGASSWSVRSTRSSLRRRCESIRPDLVVAMNPIYLDEIAGTARRSRSRDRTPGSSDVTAPALPRTIGRLVPGLRVVRITNPFCRLRAYRC